MLIVRLKNFGKFGKKFELTPSVISVGCHENKAKKSRKEENHNNNP